MPHSFENYTNDKSDSPVNINVVTESQTIQVLATVSDRREYQITCHINYQHDPIPPILLLLHEMMDGKSHEVSKRKSTFTLIPNEMTLVTSLTCLIVNQTLHYHVIPEIPVIFTMIGETTSLQTQLGEIESDQLVILTNVTIPSYVWCRTFLNPLQTPMVSEVMESKRFFVSKSQSIRLENLIPSTEYTVYCYGESVAHVTMRESLNDVKQVAVTRDAILTFDSWKEDSKVHFTLNTNLHRPSICSIIKNHQIEVVEPINGIYVSRLGEDGCQVTCHIDMDGREYSIHRECLTGLDETITMTIWRRVHPFVTELLILCLIVVVLCLFCIIHVIRKQM